MLKVTGIPVFCTWRMPEHGFVFTCTECKKWFHPSCHSTPNSIAKMYRMPRLSILNEIIFWCCFFIFFSTDHSIHGPNSNSQKTIPFTDQSHTISTDHSIHGPTSTIPLTDHSMHRPFTDRCHGSIIYKLTSHTAHMLINLSRTIRRTRTIPYTDHSIRPLSRTYNLQTNVTNTANMPITC